MNKRATHVPLHVNMPNGTTIKSYNTSELILSVLTPQTRRAHILSGLVRNSLISVRHLCGSRRDVIFTRDNVEVKKDRKSVMSSVRDQQSRLWRVALKEAPRSNYKPARNNAHENSNLKELINYLHATAFIPVKSTWIKVMNFIETSAINHDITKAMGQ
jgi:hypothetical protein